MNSNACFARRAPFLVLLIAAVVVTGCATDDQCRRDRMHAQALLLETNPSAPPPSQEAPGLRDPANRVGDVPRSPDGKGDPCPKDIFTFVRAEKGTDCNTYAAEIAGWSDRCVDECDDAARLAEAIASAQATCADFCKKKRCPGPMYAPPAKCASSACYKAADCDPKECPFRNYCMLLQGGRTWNCVCVET